MVEKGKLETTGGPREGVDRGRKSSCHTRDTAECLGLLSATVLGFGRRVQSEGRWEKT